MRAGVQFQRTVWTHDMAAWTVILNDGNSHGSEATVPRSRASPEWDASDIPSSVPWHLACLIQR